MSSVGIYMILGALVGILLAAIAMFRRGIVRTRKPIGDDPDITWFGQLAEGSGEDTSIDRRIAAGDASRRRIARMGERHLP